MLDKEITDLLTYAELHLMLDELDRARAARQIVRLLKLDGYIPSYNDEGEYDEIESMTSPNALLKPLIDNALSRGVINSDGVSALKSDIMDALILRPSEINDLFDETPNRQKAFDFLYDYNVSSGYIDLDACAANDRWQAKELQSKLEVIINVMPQQSVSGYPKCSLCGENEGLSDCASRRTITTDICGEEWLFTFSRHQYFDRHGFLANKNHTPCIDGKEMLNKLTAAADFMGQDYFVGTNAATVGDGALNTAHEHFQTGYKYTPELKAGYKKKYKSKDYPYIELGVVDWYNTVIRLSHSTREKVVEFADKIITAWKSYSDDRIVNDGKSNFVNVIARKIGDKYTLDIVLRSNGMKKHRMGIEYSEIKADAMRLTDVMGYFVLPDKLSASLQKVRSYLDGTVAYDKEKLPADMKPFAGMIERIRKEQGGSTTSLEAKLNIHDEVDVACEKILTQSQVFDDQTILPFFDLLGVKEI